VNSNLIKKEDAKFIRSLIRKRKQGNFLRKISNEERVLLDPNKKLKMIEKFEFIKSPI